MKSKLFILVYVLVVTALILTACAPQQGVTQAPPEEKKLRVVNLINGVLGDKSFFDSANRGMEMAKKDFGIEVKTIEAGIDPAKWKPALEDAAANEEYDILIVGTFQMSEFLQEVAPKYPDKKFIIYDVSVDYSKCDCKNVYSVTYKQNEGSYLAGLYAGLMSQSKIVGVIGGQDIPVINDFIVGYKQGAKDAGVSEQNVIVQYAGGWNDPAKGKEIALAMYQQGADIVFNVAGGTGVGIFQAAQEVNKYAIGVDSDQALIIETTNPEQAKHILTSMMKNVDNSLYRAIKLYLEGKLPFGQAEALGIAEGGVGLAKNKYYEEMTPADVKAKIDQAEKDILEGKIVVDTVFK
ncbi:BMP family ABC transporter substrate-binding protein [Thermanaerothrix sp. 4228-RoL]|uniref:BMP family ABC transporter substrate-binding protein n=1 Tax=Thermanaerothrix solaris TaxID=3058434 RepID=A0ABU3NRA8_9CHLR|nr:BMP family ABC transporter substrate-binding protein [Thermanaerothrix sp. 4228-RoL]MDT8899359.1 BMP family ABC transporter substrate-binding protein [Thermanaerothrix sp. 4228-RoL]